ncbi:UDP-N-acetylenolpyruvoylglucosamine reductase [Candidatus Endolissoclinum faulkneri L2]|uniref:UDP-N-acetylenolpyruvoylglucosamine reductase n=1 Tax=Candidatus Endolissoclinum faulkneri L2 TaxID=1193729 RepID=K7ZDB4_9PROT|nr:UDP-N-acetylmuramate dehydrogenase [Candidatus Endolissoclinum faulkneri]AFX99376.1 UDP-N-acetylenolpyruvoylglucosamine reductase [Candidatus Endolissoclinum faulkneri L2]
MNKLIDQLPKVRGQYYGDTSLAPLTWFKVGGPAEVLYYPADEKDLICFLANKPNGVPVTVIGLGSNLLVRSGGLDGVVIRLRKPFAKITINDDKIIAGAGALDVTVAAKAQKAGLGGLEFLSGIPGSIGGALRMNAGAYGKEVCDALISAQVLDPVGNVYIISSEDMGFSYRNSKLPVDWIVIQATFQAKPGVEAKNIAKRMRKIQSVRNSTQPYHARTCGSTFTNPSGDKAWNLINKAGCCGLRIGNAMVSELHCNFLLNIGNATSDDIERLGEEVRFRVKETSGFELDWEIHRIGKIVNVREET